VLDEKKQNLDVLQEWPRAKDGLPQGVIMKPAKAKKGKKGTQ
jgi:hypothetical protein